MVLKKKARRINIQESYKRKKIRSKLKHQKPSRKKIQKVNRKK